MSDFIEQLTIKNYGPVEDLSVRLTPIHAFIGPNDSGMSYGVSIEADKKLHETATDEQGATLFSGERPALAGPSMLHKGPEIVARPEFQRRLRRAQLLRLDPDALRASSSLIVPGGRVELINERGYGLPAVYDAIIARDVEAFVKILGEVRSLFPSVHKLGLTNVATSGAGVTSKALQATLAQERTIGADRMSEGLLYYLAFAALRHVDPVSVLLVEEPENGLHPARIAEVMRILREVSKTTQVLIATHSPLVVNELQPDEVSVVTRTPEKGTQVKLLKDTPNFEERSKVYALGELWLSYANGDDEAPLLQGGPRP
jgi:hypothetical protein